MKQGKKLCVDVAVVGGGPGGYTAAFRAADLGLRVALIEKDSRLGGTCLLRGCIPSKMLLHVASALYESDRLKDWGVHFGKARVDLDKLRLSKEGVIARLSGGIEGLRKRRKVELLTGSASFLSSTSLKVSNDEGDSLVECQKVILASGSTPRSFSPSFMTEDIRNFFMDSGAALDLVDIPPRLLIIGGGVIALELGQVYSELGSEVVLVELAERLLPALDTDLVRPLKKKLNAHFREIFTGTHIVNMQRKDSALEVSLESPSGSVSKTVDKVLIAIGREPFLKALHLENTKIRPNKKGFVDVNSRQETSDPSIFAIGDITNGPMLAHKAIAEGKIAAENVAGERSEFDFKIIPNVIYTDPEIAWCGLTEQEAKAEQLNVSVGKFHWSGSGRNLASGATDGLSKLIVDCETQRILGVGIVGKNAGELIAEGCLAIEMGATVEDLSLTMHPHPTLSESLFVASESFLNIATDI